MGTQLRFSRPAKSTGEAAAADVSARVEARRRSEGSMVGAVYGG